MANGILGGHRADPVGSFETVSLDVGTEPASARSTTAGAAPTVPTEPGSSAPIGSTPDPSRQTGVVTAPQPARPPALVPVTAPPDRSNGTTPLTVRDDSEDGHDDEYEKPEHEDEHESDDDDHHGRDDDD